MGRVAGAGAVVAVATASSVSLAGIVTASEAGDRHQVVDDLTYDRKYDRYKD